MSKVVAHDTGAPIEHIDDRKSLGHTPLKKYFEAAVRFEASDLIMRGGLPPKLRLRGKLKNLDTPSIDAHDFERWVEQSLSEAQWKYYCDHGSIDLGVDLDEDNRFRINLFRTRGRSGIAARRVSAQILAFDELYLPPVMRQIAELHQGMILLCGITGCGKSTTIASILQHINLTRACHIVTIEDPIEYIFKDDKALIHQREVGIDVPDFDTALRALVRESPDVVLIGEMRDKETFEAALQAAETGHLVLGTVHASSASQAFGRIYDMFPEQERGSIRSLLAFQIQAVVYQKLLPTLDKDIQRIPAVEILLQSVPTRKYIIEGREHDLAEVIAQHREAGMQSFTDSLVSLVETQKVHPRVAQSAANSPEEVKMRLRGISS